MKKTAIVVLAMLCGACASVPDQASDPRESREYRTGSNLPVRDRNTASMETIPKSWLEEWRTPPTARTLGGP